MQITGEDATIPGYVDAVERENKIRNAAMLNLNTRICDIEIRQMTLYHWLILDGIDSPFINGGLPDSDQLDIEKFLWVLSPNFAPRKTFSKSKLETIRKFPYGKSVVAIRQFVDDTFQDEPPATVEKGGWKCPQWSYAASLIYSVCSSLPWTRETVLHMPLKETFQIVKIARMNTEAARGEKPMGFNPSDKIKWNHIRKIREERRLAANQ